MYLKLKCNWMSFILPGNSASSLPHPHLFELIFIACEYAALLRTKGCKMDPLPWEAALWVVDASLHYVFPFQLFQEMVYFCWVYFFYWFLCVAHQDDALMNWASRPGPSLSLILWRSAFPFGCPSRKVQGTSDSFHSDLQDPPTFLVTSPQVFGRGFWMGNIQQYN